MGQSARKTKPMALGTSDASPSLHPCPCTVPESVDRLLPRIDRSDVRGRFNTRRDQPHPVQSSALLTCDCVPRHSRPLCEAAALSAYPMPLLPMPGSSASSWAVYRARLNAVFHGADPRVCAAFWLFGTAILLVLIFRRRASHLATISAGMK